MKTLPDRIATPMLALPRAAKRLLAVLLDVALCVLSVWLAYYLRLGEFVSLVGQPLWAVAVSIVLAVPIFILSGLYRAIFRYSGWPALLAVARAVVLYAVLYAAMFTAIGVPGVPRTLGIIQPILLLLLVGLSRLAVRFWLGEEYQRLLQRAARPRVLIYGAGTTGRQLMQALLHSLEMQVVGFLDDDARLQGQVLNGLPIYKAADLPGLIEDKGVRDVLLAMPRISRQRRNEILDQLRLVQVAVRTLPSFHDLAQGRVSLSDLRELDIDDLLGRDSVASAADLLAKNISGKVVLVTGAGGSIGSELCRQILALSPNTLLLVELSEFALYGIHQELEQRLAACRTWIVESENRPQRAQFLPDLQPNSPAIGQKYGEKWAAAVDLQPTTSKSDRLLGNAEVRLIPLLASVQDRARMHEILAAWRPHTLYHAAAYKHVPMVEHNPAEGVKNNLLGTLRTAQAAMAQGVADFVLISTDKAVRPTNIMGASKRLAEMALQALAASTTGTRFSMVRFGNVLGSSGSVVPKFRQQIRDGGPITLTHPDIIRYFMSIPEAAQLVIQAGAMARGGEVFVLDMGGPVRIMDLARRMVELSGLVVRDEARPDGDIEIQTIGLRPGEKLYEELLIGENPEPTEHPRIMKAHEAFLSWDELEVSLKTLEAALNANDASQIRQLLQNLVTGYVPSGEIVDWLYLEKGRDAARLLEGEMASL